MVVRYPPRKYPLPHILQNRDCPPRTHPSDCIPVTVAIHTLTGKKSLPKSIIFSWRKSGGKSIFFRNNFEKISKKIEKICEQKKSKNFREKIENFPEQSKFFRKKSKKSIFSNFFEKKSRRFFSKKKVQNFFQKSFSSRPINIFCPDFFSWQGMDGYYRFRTSTTLYLRSRGPVHESWQDFRNLYKDLSIYPLLSHEIGERTL